MAMQTPPLLMSILLDRGARVAPGEEVVTFTADGVHRQTLEQTHRRACRLANALSSHGIAIGDRVASFMWNNHRHLEMYQALPSMGAVLHTLNIRLSTGDLEYIINHAGDRVVVVDEDLLPQLERLAEMIPCVERVVVCSDNGGWTTTLPNAVDYEDFIAAEPSVYDWPALSENAPMGLCYTSGTTGNPKGVMYTHRSTYLHTIAVCLRDALALSATDCVCGIVPMFHAMGWGVPFAALMVGSKQVMNHNILDGPRLLDIFETERVTISTGVPTIWQGVMAAVDADPRRWNLAALDRVTCGGSAPPQNMMRWFWDTLGVEMIQGWGMTETNPLGTVSRKVAKYAHRDLSEDRQFDNIAKAGQLMPGLEMEIVDENFDPLPHDGESVGELLIRGPWICSEYYNDPQPDRFHDGWLITGDVAKIDADEYLIIADRSKDLIKSGGEWISSVDLENFIVALEGVAQAAVVARPHPKWDERPVALLVLAKGARVSSQEVIEHCSKRFAKWQLPDDVIFEDSLPLTSTGKIDKKAIRAELARRGYELPDLRA